MFRDLGLSFEVIPAEIAEDRDEDEAPPLFARRMAEEKGRAVAEELERQGRRPWIVSADTVVVLDGEVLCKPADQNEAREMLGKLSGRTHVVITGWCVGQWGRPFEAEHAETQVTFHRLGAREIDGYVATGEGMDKAGAYAIQKIGAFLVDRIEGNYFNVVGLPISHVVRTLIEVGAIPTFPVS